MIARDLKVGERFRFARSLLQMMLDEAQPPSPCQVDVIVEYIGVHENGDGTVDVFMRNVLAPAAPVVVASRAGRLTAGTDPKEVE